ncbi:type II toxin-antitoxin system VapC family toxin [Planktothrix sp. FACHB-1355]|uniref:Type II toxin-antitoxin system VapC family toxin n=1 Tax=Aerosakkonema funiforme FACHB-1375 TaxID=2949571 RepID=A0A926VLQ8_9CYAN|nr:MULTISPECIES: type II toxin-antitoxin system VapC family toxin [Oscillatoriales]MBD2184769.1 type II toxin-antitoxin system VapC family toxin [Aerosakkonema funiforme FACHB-1375]MBD3559062.1 type II toxin-antitoxin system VapC family toxin [Planktothrix sp. FACHB-1355]
MLIDSNIIIYASQAEYPHIRQFIGENDIAVSALSYVEVLGYHRLTEESRLYFEEFFRIVEVLPISQAVLARSVTLRQMRRMTLGDAIIAATALVYDRTLVTRNTGDFEWIGDLTLFNPFDGEET